MGVDLHPSPLRVVHQDQGDPIVSAKIADADVLPISAQVSEAQRLLVENTQEAWWAAPVLDVGPAGLRDSGHVEAVALGDERLFCLGEPVELPMTFEVTPDLTGAVGRLGGADAGRHGDV